ncbi:MAG: DNA-directed RNA polymerase [Vezdaea aestivalis]|nr:MAG: DNA-directed RNA polymerase [Vezdaea aestivalis]
MRKGGNDVAEIRATLEACLQVYQMDRAFTLIRRLSKMYGPDSEDLREIYTVYLEAVVQNMVETCDEAAVKKAETCFNLLIRERKIKPDAFMYALMIKLSLQLPVPQKLERSLRRYVQMAQDDGYDIEELNQPILSDNDINRVIQLYSSTYNMPAELEQEVEAIESPRKHLDDIAPTNQKGLGLASLKSSLASFDSDEEEADPTVTRGSVDRQRQLEASAIAASVERWKEENEMIEKTGVLPSLSSPRMGSLMWTWFKHLAPAVQAETDKLTKAENDPNFKLSNTDLLTYGPFLRLLPAERVAAVTIIHIMHCLAHPTKSNRVSSVVASVGQALEDESIAEAIKRNIKNPMVGDDPHTQYQQRLAKMISKAPAARNNSTQAANWLSRRLRHSILFKNEPSRDWSDKIRFKVGAAAISLLVKTAMIPVERHDANTGDTITQRQPAFKHVYEYIQGRKIGMLSLNFAVKELLAQNAAPASVTKLSPMVCKPKPWTGLKEGGYMETRLLALRTKNGSPEQLEYANAASERGDMDQIYRSLDVLGQIPWKINRSVLEVMLKAWNSGEAIAEIPEAKPQLSSPEELSPDATLEDRLQWSRKMKEVENLRSGLHSQRCFINYQLEVARAYAEEDFFFPHNVDFRGRAYPIPPYLNHMGADNARGLLRFSEAKELGANGLGWLKVQLANVFGFDKASLKERQTFTMEHLDDIFDSADHPLDGRRWWLKAEDPWQCLATCFELKLAMQAPDPTKFKSSLPVHQDGTCNGLQHYAALGGDSIGAKQVNLEPGDRPSDLYTAVSELVKDALQEEADRGNKVALKLIGYITRKVVKQTVMTNVYGVTFIGAVAQIKRQLDDIISRRSIETDGISHRQMSALVARKVFEALTTMFEGARKIQFWLAEAGTRISDSLTPEQIDWIIAESKKPGGKISPLTSATSRSKVQNPRTNHFAFRSSIIWTTPLQMPVVQPYRVHKKDSISTNLQRISLASPDRADPVDKRKQVQAFPPNFIHSLDATHMHVSALRCSELGLSFAAVHDSFWTHAGDVDSLNAVLRDSFVKIHSEDIMGRLTEEFNQRYAGSFYWANLDVKSVAGQKIKAWRAQRGTKREVNKRVDELVLERQRATLLSSDDAEARKEGQQMITPLSIIEDLAQQENKDCQTYINQITNFAKATARDQPLQKTMNAKREVLLSQEGQSVELDTETTQIDKENVLDLIESKIRKAGKFWLPLSFPPVPSRGDFDVSRLRSSKYFFS